MNRTSFTIGSARCGKSTFWQRWLKEPDRDGLNRVVLCRDVWRLAYYGERFNASRESDMHERFDVAWRALHSTGQYHIGIDETSTTVKSIRSILRVDPFATPYFIDTPYEVCLERAYTSNQAYLAERGVIKRMFDNIITLCNYRVAKCAMLPEERYDLISDSYVYEAVRKIRDEVLEEKECQVQSQQ